MSPLRLPGAGVVVTGAGSGIGAGLARGLAGSGARVVVNDVDAEAAGVVAEQVGGLAAPADAASEAGIIELLAQARDWLGGEVDLFCANAGVARGGGPEAPDTVWETSLQVNLMGHVYAARHLLPGWLARGRGHFLATVSAAGLLTMIGSAPYAVSKHAALAFAEWLSLTYADRGITVQALCPQGVRTPMLDALDPAGHALLDPDALEVGQVVQAVLAGLADGRFLVLPHPQVAGFYAARAADPDGWLASMSRLRQRVEGGEVVPRPGSGPATAPAAPAAPSHGPDLTVPAAPGSGG